MDLYNDIQKHLFREGKALEAQVEGWLVAVSGGLDSTALLRLLCECDQKKPIQVLHVNYRLRGRESDQDAEFVGRLCADLGIPLTTYRVSDAELEAARGKNTQEWAREIRREKWQAFVEKGFGVALGHHQGDLAENVLLRMIRGVGPGQLAGMQNWEAPIWRPLLTWNKSQLADIARQKGYLFREDSSNDKIEYSRNFIRHEILPRMETLYPGAEKRIAQLGEVSRDIGESLVQTIDKELITPKGLLVSKLLSLNDGVAMCALRHMVSRTSEPIPQLSRPLLEKLLAKLRESDEKGENMEKTWCFDVPGGLVFKFDRGYALVEKTNQKQKTVRVNQHRKGLEDFTTSNLVEPGGKWECFNDV